MAKNTYSVPKKQWGKWSKLAQAVFNRAYRFFLRNQRPMNHPKAPPLPTTQWRTVAWNAAWIGASAVDNVVPTKIVTRSARK